MDEGTMMEEGTMMMKEGQMMMNKGDEMQDTMMMKGGK